MLNAAHDYTALQDAALVDYACGGDREAFRAIMQRFNQRLFRIARAVVCSDQEAEDVLQEAYLNAFAGLPKFRQESGLLTWLTAITLNEARGRLRKRREVVEWATVDAQQSNVVNLPGINAPEDPEAEAGRAEARRLMERAIDTLPEDFRIVFVLRAIEGCTIEETAAQLNLNPLTVRTRLHRARKLLRQELKQHFVSGLATVFPFLGIRCQRITQRVLAALDR